MIKRREKERESVRGEITRRDKRREREKERGNVGNKMAALENDRKIRI